MYVALAILAFSAVFFVSGRIRSDLVALIALVLLIVTGLVTPAEALSGFSNPIVIMMVGLFVVGGAILQTGLAKRISGKILQLAGGRETLLFLLVMLVTAAIGAFVSNTGTVALMIPIVVSIAASSGMSASRMLMPLAFASSMGGMMTLIGTPPNLVIQNVLTDAGYEPLSFFSFAPVGVVCVLAGIIVLTPLSRIFLSKKGGGGRKSRGKSLEELADEYRLSQNLFRVGLPRHSAAAGQTVVGLNIGSRYGVNVVEVRRVMSSQSRFLKSVSQKLAADTVLQDGDIIYVTGDFENVRRFASELKMDLVDTHTPEGTAQYKGDGRLDFYDIGIAEIVLLSTSTLVNRRVRDSGLRDSYDVNVLGIRRGSDYILRDIRDVSLHSGDVLLVQGSWNDISRLSEAQSEWVVMGQPLAEAAKVTLDYKAPLAGAIMVLMVAGMVFGSGYIDPVIAVMIAAILMVLTGCIRNVEAAYKTINWESVVLIAAMLPMSLALEKTGASTLISHTLVDSLGSHGPLALLAGIYFTTSLLTLFISNTATAVLLAPIAMASAVETGVSPYPFLFAVSVGASMSFASPFSTPPNALVMQAGQYTFVDYLKVGLPMQIIMGVVMVFVLPLIFPF